MIVPKDVILHLAHTIYSQNTLLLLSAKAIHQVLHQYLGHEAAHDACREVVEALVQVAMANGELERTLQAIVQEQPDDPRKPSVYRN